jgi:hypothetical protein
VSGIEGSDGSEPAVSQHPQLLPRPSRRRDPTLILHEGANLADSLFAVDARPQDPASDWVTEAVEGGHRPTLAPPPVPVNIELRIC